MFEGNHHPNFNCGSTIRLTNMTNCGHRHIPNRESFIKEISSSLADTYCKAIREEALILSISIDNDPPTIIEPPIDIFTEPECSSRTIIHHLKIFVNKHTYSIEKILIHRVKSDKNTYLNSELKNIYKKKYTEEINTIPTNCIIIDARMRSTSTAYTDYDNTHNNNSVKVFRCNRCYGNESYIPFVTDSWGLHITNEIHYDSKILNPSMGILFNKGLNSRINNPLITLIGCIQKKMRSKYFLHKKVFTPVPTPPPVDSSPPVNPLVLTPPPVDSSPPINPPVLTPPPVDSSPLVPTPPPVDSSPPVNTPVNPTSADPISINFVLRGPKTDTHLTKENYINLVSKAMDERTPENENLLRLYLKKYASLQMATLRDTISPANFISFIIDNTPIENLSIILIKLINILYNTDDSIILGGADLVRTMLEDMGIVLP